MHHHDIGKFSNKIIDDEGIKEPCYTSPQMFKFQKYIRPHFSQLMEDLTIDDEMCAFIEYKSTIKRHFLDNEHLKRLKTTWDKLEIKKI